MDLNSNLVKSVTHTTTSNAYGIIPFGNFALPSSYDVIGARVTSDSGNYACFVSANIRLYNISSSPPTTAKNTTVTIKLYYI